MSVSGFHIMVHCRISKRDHPLVIIVSRTRLTTYDDYEQSGFQENTSIHTIIAGLVNQARR